MHLSMLSKHFRPHISACISVSFQTWRRLQQWLKACLLLQPDVLFQRLPSYYKIQPTEWEIYIKEIDEKSSKVLRSLKLFWNYFEKKMKDYRSSFLPHCIEKFHELSAAEDAITVNRNQLFYGMLAFHGRCKICKDSLKNFESLVDPEMIQGFRNEVQNISYIVGDFKSFDLWSWIWKQA